ncbi:hypothetical protein FKP32DRAFT_1283260 [Trametes sanguinea]|nr:hypothetical protein FKP32DRAFT_1283260 [Trametes sanguinea]
MTPSSTSLAGRFPDRGGSRWPQDGSWESASRLSGHFEFAMRDSLMSLLRRDVVYPTHVADHPTRTDRDPRTHMRRSASAFILLQSGSYAGSPRTHHEYSVGNSPDSCFASAHFGRERASKLGSLESGALYFAVAIGPRWSCHTAHTCRTSTARRQCIGASSPRTPAGNLSRIQSDYAKCCSWQSRRPSKTARFVCLSTRTLIIRQRQPERNSRTYNACSTPRRRPARRPFSACRPVNLPCTWSYSIG